jgi:hypothetical protein
MKNIVSTLACLLICGSVFAEDKIEVKKPVVVEKVKVVPKVGIAVPVVKPLPGKFYWKHPSFGWGYWYYPEPTTLRIEQNYYLDELGRVVPNGYAYDPDGNLVPLAVVKGVYVYPYRYHHGRWTWWRR